MSVHLRFRVEITHQGEMVVIFDKWCENNQGGARLAGQKPRVEVPMVGSDGKELCRYVCIAIRQMAQTGCSLPQEDARCLAAGQIPAVDTASTNVEAGSELGAVHRQGTSTNATPMKEISRCILRNVPLLIGDSAGSGDDAVKK